LDAGADEICLVLGDQNIDDMLKALPHCDVHFEAGDRAAEVLEALSRAPVSSGSVDYEPLADFDRAARFVRAIHTPNFRPITIRANRFPENGATVVQELAFAIAEGVEIIAQLTDRGVAPDDAAQSLAFWFAIGPNYFLEIAKLRAARTLWSRAVASFHPAQAGSAKMTIYARTAHWTKTIYDPYVNLLRSTTEAMAAAIGGADAIQVGAFDRNISSERCFQQPPGAQHPIDPEAGSLAGSLRRCGGRIVLSGIAHRFACPRKRGRCFKESKRRAAS
jgi:hypothetical protein